MQRESRPSIRFEDKQRQYEGYLWNENHLDELMMSLFNSEQDMQQWLSNRFQNGEDLAEMTINYTEYKDVDLTKSNTDQGYRKILSSFKHCLNSFENTEVLTENIDISLNPKDILRPDFIIYAATTQSIVIIELKNLKGSTRQAGTEISAYASEIRTYLPFLAEGDIINVIISSEWPTLLRHYIYNEIVWLNKQLICLEPFQDEKDISLKIIDPLTILDPQIKPYIYSKQLGGYQLCLYNKGTQNTDDYYSMGQFEQEMMTALHAMSSKGNALKAHGFAFLWRHAFAFGNAPYNITVINFASFQSPDLVFEETDLKSNKMGSRLIEILKDYAPEGHGQTLDSIVEYGQQFLNGFCRPIPEGFTSWEYLKPYIFERTDALAFVGWGLFQDQFFDKLLEPSEALEDGHLYNYNNPLVAIEMLNEIIYERYPFNF